MFDKSLSFLQLCNMTQYIINTASLTAHKQVFSLVNIHEPEGPWWAAQYSEVKPVTLNILGNKPDNTTTAGTLKLIIH